MSIEFLKRLFTVCSEEAGNGYRDGLNLSELYTRIEETAKTEQEFSEARSKAELAPAVEDSIGSTAYAVIRAYESQGFINGFRLCAQMGRELGGEGASANKWYASAIIRLLDGANVRELDLIHRFARELVSVEEAAV